MQVIYRDFSKNTVITKTKKGSTAIRLVDFANINGLTLVVTDHGGKVPRITCDFEECEVKHGNLLFSSYGEGTTEKEAVRDYIATISGKCLVYKAHEQGRKEFNVPLLKL